MVRKLDIDSWNRKEHFKFFKEFDEPFFGVTFNVEVTEAYELCKSEGLSFFIFYLYASLRAANRIPEFKYRIREKEVMVFDTVNASPTINRDNGTFGFSYMDYHEDFAVFYQTAKAEIERVRAKNDLIPSGEGENVIHFSALPWLQFTAVSHARNFKFKDSIPKISFGKIFEDKGEKYMPVSVHVHHALMDGYHVGMFAENFQEILKTKPLLKNET